MKIFISGGCKNGKSYYAQLLAKMQCTDFLYYVATMRPVDTEDDNRISRHRHDREGWGFTTIEQPVDIESILDKCDNNSSFVLDSLTALLLNEMFHPDARINNHAARKIADGLLRITEKIKKIVIVSDYIYSDALVYDSITETYRKSLAEIDRSMAEYCDVVLEVAYGNVIIHKGEKIFGGLYYKIL